jgi:hypothetical protein
MIIHFILGTLAIAIILTNVFYSFPIMGHDYSIVVTWAFDYHYAWQKFSQFFFHFSPQRCLGIPVWANPIGFSLSLYHLLSAFFTDIYAIALFIGIYISAGYLGAVHFLKTLKVEKNWIYYLAFAWCLQGSVVMRATVGHISYLSVVLWPLYAYLLLKENSLKSKKGMLEIGLVGLMLAHDFYSGSPTIYVLFPLSFLLMLIVMKVCDWQIEYRKVLLKLILIVLTSAVVILPKVLAIFSFTRNFQRQNSFVDVGLSAGFSYSFLSQLFPPILDYKKMTGWWYGDWEAFNFIFPGLVLIAFLISAVRFKQYPRILAGFLLVFFVGGVIASGVYADIVKTLPIVKSFHVNPRWLMMLSLPFSIIVISFLDKSKLSAKFVLPLAIFTAIIPFYLRDPQNLGINYVYRNGLQVEKNVLNGCYEPVFGYSLELFPFKKIVPGKYLDPRCYLKKGGCQSMVLPDDKEIELKEYRLRPFE